MRITLLKGLKLNIIKVLVSLVMTVSLGAECATSGSRVDVRVTVMAEPCVIEPGRENIPLDFGIILDNYLYLNQRTPGLPFEIRLAQCDPEISKTVAVKFYGKESLVLPGLMAVNEGSGATGIAIGLETPEAKPLPLNKLSDKYDLLKGSNVISLRAYVRGEPDALTRKNLGKGEFSAVATFSLEYE
ncbi:fimbrial protein [Klebsiella oxytoca]|uniref:fimbrial protein n=1 Tax=Klebsiella oxytoca TaxID=571 RepID=UPI000D525B92|nr:fimbrial protein [Klebsiella oxytoca]